jgi:hypothetical protein
MGDIYIALDTYPYHMVPQVCRTGTYKDRLLSTQSSNYPVVYMGVYKSTQLTASTDYTTNIVPAFGYKYYKAEYNQPLIISETNVDYQAGTTVTILVDINYINPDYPNQAKGFTLSTYSRRSLTILNEFNANFQQHMDGQTPSGFMNAPAVASADITPNGGQFDFG